MFFAPSGLPYLGSFTWANRPDVVQGAGNTFFCTDVGGGVFLYSDGKVWRSPSASPIRIAWSEAPMCVPSSGTVGANGALSGIGGVGTQYAAAGIWMSLPAGAAFAGSPAGMYWVVMSSTTTGTIFNNVYSGGINTPPASPTPIVAAGPGAFTQVTTEATLFSWTLPGGFLGPNGRIDVVYPADYTNSANTKIFRNKAAGTVWDTYTATTSANLMHNGILLNTGTQSRQVSSPNNGSAAFGTPATFKLTVNTATDTAMTFTVQPAVATETLVVHYLHYLVDPR